MLPPLIRRRLTAALAGLTLSLAPVATSAQTATDPVEALQQVRAAMGARDYPAAVRALQAMGPVATTHPQLLRALARAQILAGDHAGAIATLRRLAPLGLAADIAADSAFAPLRSDSGFAGLAAELARSAAPLVRSDTVLTVADPDLLPESIAHDSVDGTFYLGSLHRNRVVRVARDGTVADFAVLGPVGRGRVIGIKVDARRRLLWAASVQVDSAAPRTFAGVGGWTALTAHDLRTGREVRRLEPTDRTRPHLFNDVALAPNGDVYVTDQWGDAVWRAPAEGGALERVIGGTAGFHWPNGIDLSPDGRRLYVAHLEGISTLDLATGRLVSMAHPRGVAMADTDGLYACRLALVVVQRAADFEQVVRLALSPSGDRIIGRDVMERRHPAYQGPTTGVILGDRLLYIANSQFGRLSPDGRLAPAARPAGTVVLGLPLGRCR